MSINLLFYIFSVFVLASGLLSIVSKNSVHAVLYLVLTFFSSAWIMLLLNAEFLAMLLIIVYVGAIAVLFLFVVMMLQTKYQHRPSKLQTTAAFFVSTMIFVQIFSFLTLKTGKEQSMIISNIPLVQISQALYIENFANFQVVGLILLIAMVAVILLTHMQSSTLTHKQDISKQVLRTKEESIIITKPESGKGVVL